MSGRDVCEYRDAWDPATLEPVGEPCGKPAAEVIYWNDGRYSPACAEHGVGALTREAKTAVLCAVATPAGREAARR